VTRPWSFPAALEDALWQAAAARLGPAALTPRALEAAIAERTRRYTGERERLTAPVPVGERGRDLAARALFFGVADAAKIAVPLAELSGRGRLPTAEPLRLLDVGAGALAMTLGVAAALPERRLDALAVDLDADALALGAAAVATLAPRVTLRTMAADLSRVAPPDGPFDLIVAGTLLNELTSPARPALARGLLERLRPGGALILLEPALRDTARALHALRDALLTAGDAHVFAPCTRAGAPCPALADPSDWCHEDRPVAPPPRLAELSRRTNLRTGGLKFAYLVLRLDDAPLVDVPPGRHALRVVSGALDQKGNAMRLCCGDDGFTRQRRLRRSRDASLAALDEARRGDVLVTGADDTLELRHPAQAR
jgi:ribosomal protein RSM22 (predicted rRNA methylase)